MILMGIIVANMEIYVSSTWELLFYSWNNIDEWELKSHVEP